MLPPCRPIDYEYSALVRHVLEHGEPRPNRTGVDTLGVFGYQYRVDLAQGFPLLTTKKLHWPSIVGELLWFLRGDTNVRWLQERGIRIWNEWADSNGELGPIYGRQWRCWESKIGLPIDQIGQIIKGLRDDPYSRRHILSAWNVDDLPKMALAPCHYVSQFYVSKGRLSCLLNMRSSDIFLGLPFNTASYALLTHILAKHANLGVGELVVSLGDAHIYHNHIPQLKEQLLRTPYASPVLNDFPIKPLEDLDIGDFTLTGYKAHPALKGEVAV